MKNIPDRLTPAEAWERMSSVPPLSAETKKIEQASGQFLASDVVAPCDVPEADRSFMDGFAVRSADVRQVPVRLRIAGEIFMGEVSHQRLQEREAMFIPTGGFLPEGADAVVMQEDTERADLEVLIRKSVTHKENVQRQGEDFKKGEILFSSHHQLRSQDIGALATFGIGEVSVFRKPGIAVISTGNELVEFHRQPGPGQIRETNALTLATAARQFGFQVQTLGIINDQVQSQKDAMAKALSLADVVLVSGGSSVGERDYTMEVIQSFSHSSIHFHGLAIRPGNPTIFATIGPKAVFGLPGQPVSSLIVLYQFVFPLLFHLSGEKIDYPNFATTKFPGIRAVLKESIQPLKSKTDYVRIRLQQEKDACIAIPVLGKSASLSTLTRADAFTVIPPGEESIPEQTEITAFLFP
jgi:molybdopterin molybdotransferase